MPGFTVNQVAVPYFGQQIKFAGERNYDNWDVSVYNDDDFSLRALLEKWSNIMNTLVSNRLDPSAYPNLYKGTAEVTQFGKDGRTLRIYRFVGIFPTQISPIQLDWQPSGQIEQFQVSFSIDYYEPIAQNSSPDQYNVLLPDEPAQGSISGVPQGTFNA